MKRTEWNTKVTGIEYAIQSNLRVKNTKDNILDNYNFVNKIDLNSKINNVEKYFIHQTNFRDLDDDADSNKEKKMKLIMEYLIYKYFELNDSPIFPKNSFRITKFLFGIVKLTRQTLKKSFFVMVE